MGRRKIEGYEGLTIDKEGEVVNEETGKEVRQRELRGTVVISYKGSVLEVYKLILKAFNPYELENVSNYDVLSSRRIKYKDGNKWNLKLENIEVKEGFLEYLNNGRDDIYFTNRKEIDSMWEYEENIKRGLNPKKLNIKSTRKAKWKCDKGHSFEDEIKNVLRREIKCRVCFEDRRKLNKRKEKDRCVLPITQTHTEDIKAYWDYDKNGKIRPTDYTYGSSKEVWWECEYGHSYRKPIHRQLYTKRCMECGKWGKVSIPQQVVYNLLRNNFKHVEMEKPFGKYRGDIYLGDEEILIEYDGIAFHKGKEKIKKDVQRDIQILQKENNNVRKIIRIRETGETHTREEVEGVELVNYDSTRDIKERGYRDLIKVTEYLIKGIKGECTTLSYEDMDIYTNTIWSSKATNLFDKFPHLIGYFGIKNKEDTNLITYGSEMWFEWECQKCGNSWEEQPIKISKRKEINVCIRCKKERELNVGEEDKKRRLELIKKRKKRKEDRECVVCGRKAYGGGKEEWVTYCSRECQTESERKIKVQGEGKLYQELVETPVFDIVAKRYGVSTNTLRRECKRNGIPNNSKYYTDKYKEEKGYTYYTWLEYLKYKEERKEDYEYVVKNLGVKTKNQLTKKEKVVTLNVYSVIEREKSVEGV